MKNRDFWINQAFFQASWPACVIGAANGMLWPGALVVGLFALWQLQPARAAAGDWRVVAAFFVTGLVADTLLVQTGVVEYATAWPAAGIAPAWLLLLWVALGLTVNHSLGLFRRRWGMFILLAAFGSPMSYSVAAGFGAVTWVAPTWLVLLCLGPGWGLIVGLLFRHAGRRKGSDGRTARQPRVEAAGSAGG
ncbi:MAG: DUF2878 domain-containing protein [Wenzhouxiangellaceae bacterium]|nr:DUF2878 domain-containing protein [Wenzhouxiangellaceae bacterium]MBS3824459.1 DUF2878 domain-containing protein [Wenzhouxiangellaceae bacterium]